MSFTGVLTSPMESLLSGFPAWPGADQARLEIIGSGLNNHVVRVRFAGQDLVVRQSLPAGAAVKLSAAQELEALAAASDAGIAPPLRALDVDAGVSVSDYLPGAHAWTSSDLGLAGNLQRLARQLKAMHSLDFELPDYDVESVAQIYAARIPALESGYQGELLSLAVTFREQFKGRVFCHNDLIAENILDNGRLWLIDFEYAVKSDPILDLAGVAALNGLPPDVRGQLLSAYYGLHAPTQEQFDQVCRMVLLMALVWVQALRGATPSGRWLALQQTMLTRLRQFPLEK